jgi:5S rRNA maturation endonuclease (ribonuclease M5)
MDMTQPIDNVLARVNHSQAGKNQWDATCPCRNDDDNPSLRISVGNQNQVLMKCQRGGGCNINEICDSIGLEVGDLFPQDTEKPKKSKLDLVETYKYFYADNTLALEVLRFVDDRGKKTFRQRKPDGAGGYNWSTSDIEKPLYRLPQVLQAIKDGRPIYVVEGEKDVHALETLGKTATTNAGGAGGEGQKKWTPEHTKALSKANVIIICDNDEAGYLHARSVNADLTEAGATVKVFKPGKWKDVSDLLEAGETLQEGLTPFDTEVYEPTEEAQENDSLSTLIESLKSIDKDQADAIVMGRASAAFDNFITVKDRQHQDKGTLVEWSPFLETNVDLSYDWVIPNLLERQERVIVVAAEGAGKTTLARQVALMSAAGIHPFRREAMEPVRTLMIDLENPERIIRRTSLRIYDKIKMHKKHDQMDAHLMMKPDGINLLTPADRALVEEHVASVEPDILFFGPLYKAFLDPGGRTAESVSIEIARFLDYIRHTYNCALWIEHHAPLGSGGQRDLRPFGSAVWSRWSEFGIALSPDPTDPELIEFKHYRGQREAREWPTLCKRGNTWPFEVVEFAQYTNTINPAAPELSDEELNEALENEEFDDKGATLGGSSW